MSKILEKQCPDCDVRMLEVNDAVYDNGQLLRNLYPKGENAAIHGKYYHEYRFFCRKCKEEWIYFSRPDARRFERIPESSQCRYSEKKKVLLFRSQCLKK